jgi:hypothetical protein
MMAIRELERDLARKEKALAAKPMLREHSTWTTQWLRIRYCDQNKEKKPNYAPAPSPAAVT